MPATVDPEDVYSFIEAHSSNLETYQPAPPSPHWGHKAAVDYMMVLTIAGSAASIAQVLCMASKKFKALFHIIIRKDDGKIDEFPNGLTDEVSVEKFSRTVETIKHSEASGESTEHVIEETRSESIWTRRK
jgi:hypothetical protein